MNVKGEIIAYHGWGFDRNCWKEWQKILSSHCQFQTYDRGYFQEENYPEFKHNNLTKIIFAHSFGLHLCPVEQLKKADLLILFNSFSEFHPEDKRLRKYSKYALKLMINEFKNNPKKVLESFYKKCYYPFTYIPRNYHFINLNKLEEDLKLLNTSKLDINLLKKIPYIYIFQGSKDKIYSVFYTQEFHKKLSHNSQYYEIKDAGHNLAFTNIKSCLSIVNQVLGETDDHGTNQSH